MIRIFALLALAILLTSCSRIHSRAQGPFSTPKKEPPPPYGAIDPGSIAMDTDSAGDDANAFPPFNKRKQQPQPLPSPLAPNTPGELPPSPPDAPKNTPKPDVPNNAPKPDATNNAPKESKDLAQLKELMTNVEGTWKNVSTYEATLTRREISPKGQMTSEVLLYQFRREPMSLFTRNISGGGKGREVVYNPGKHGDKMHVMVGEGDTRLLRPGSVAPPISPDDSKVTEKARYSIRDAGFGRSIKELTSLVAKIEAGKLPADTLTYQGNVKRDEYTYPLVGITQKLRKGDEPLMPEGGTRQYFFDMKKDSPSYGMPVLIIATDPKGKEAEYYLFEKVKSPANLTDADFNPARLGKK